MQTRTALQVVPERPTQPLPARLLTILIVAGPIALIAVAIPVMWGDRINLRDLLAAVVLYLISGHGIAVGYHRLFAHRGFVPNRAVKLVLAGAGAMAVEGSLIGWVAAHRRHHRFSDHPGDPHSPHVDGDSVLGLARGLVHAHVGWLFRSDSTSEAKYAPDLLADPDLVRMSALWPVFALGSLILPFGVGWIWTGTLAGAWTMFFWAGAVRMLLLHHVTWSVNSICHLFGDRPFRTRDHSANVAVLGVLSMGESFHNLHHAYPSSARHGALRHQPDSSAGVIRLLERAGWVTNVEWPTPKRVFALVEDPASFDTARLRRAGS